MRLKQTLLMLHDAGIIVDIIKNFDSKYHLPVCVNFNFIFLEIMNNITDD